MFKISFPIILFIFSPILSWAQTSEPVEIELPTLQVFGSGPENLQRPAAPKKVSKEKVETYQYTDVNRALKQTSGVYSREEDGQGLRPNIGLRGTNPDRSKKVTLMQDEVLIGPAPYSAPAAYYTPTMNHTSSLEIYKGFAATPYGPNSIGGAINYLTPDLPIEKQNKVSATAGSYQTSNLKFSLARPSSLGGYLLEGSKLHSDGFKKLPDGNKTGFDQNHFLLKAAYDFSNTSRFILTLGYGDENSRETYLGISPTDFEQDPYQRYAASQVDTMKWTHTRFNLKHIWQMGNYGSLESTVYRHDFHRDWYRLDRFGNSAVNLRDVVNNPTGNQAYFDILKGISDSSSLAGQNGELIVANNDRAFVSQGLQSKYSYTENFEQGKNQFDFLVRAHSDEIRRNHTSDNFAMNSGKMERTTAPRSQVDLNRDQAQALTFSMIDNFDFKDWTLTPVLRYETVNFNFKNDLTGSSTKRNDSFWVPGFGVTRKLFENYSLRLSANKATTVAGLSSDGTEQREDANNYEAELKYQNLEQRVEGDLTFFKNDYRNITGTCSLSVGCTGSQLDQQFNGGAALIQGVEARLAAEYQMGTFVIPLQINFTHLQAKFANTFNSSSPEWGLGTVKEGDPLPYIPDTQYSVSLGLVKGAWNQDVTLSYFGRMYDQSVESGRQQVKAHGVVDWAGSYKFRKSLQLTAKADNLLANNHVVGLRPYGLRPGKPQSFQVGLVYTF
jgi:Fe(3+) dicitrate transport protein